MSVARRRSVRPGALAIMLDVAEPLVARLVDNAGNPLASRPVRFEVIRNSGSLTAPSGQTGRVVSPAN